MSFFFNAFEARRLIASGQLKVHSKWPNQLHYLYCLYRTILTVPECLKNIDILCKISILPHFETTRFQLSLSRKYGQLTPSTHVVINIIVDCIYLDIFYLRTDQ